MFFISPSKKIVNLLKKCVRFLGRKKFALKNGKSKKSSGVKKRRACFLNFCVYIFVYDLKKIICWVNIDNYLNQYLPSFGTTKILEGEGEFESKIFTFLNYTYQYIIISNQSSLTITFAYKPNTKRRSRVEEKNLFWIYT